MSSPPAPVGQLLDLTGKVVGSIHAPASSIHAPDSEEVELSVGDKRLLARLGPRGELIITSTETTDNRALAASNALLNYRNTLDKRREDLALLNEQIQQQMGVVENVMMDDADSQGEGFAAEESSRELTNFIGLRGRHVREIQTLEECKELEVRVCVRSGITATLRPGIVTAVSFLPTPLVWLPRSLADEKPGEVKEEVVKVSTQLVRIDGTGPTILDASCLTSIGRMLFDCFQAGSTIKLKRLHDNSNGNTTAGFYRAVKGKARVLTVIQAANGYVFGCYVGDTYGGPPGPQGWSTGHADNFLFSLGDKAHGSGSEVKLLHNAGKGRLHISSRGVHMGERPAELVAFCFTHSTALSNDGGDGFTTVAPGFSPLPAGQTIAGTPGAFVPSVMEVYQVCV